MESSVDHLNEILDRIGKSANSYVIRRIEVDCPGGNVNVGCMIKEKCLNFKF